MTGDRVQMSRAHPLGVGGLRQDHLLAQAGGAPAPSGGPRRCPRARPSELKWVASSVAWISGCGLCSRHTAPPRSETCQPGGRSGAEAGAGPRPPGPGPPREHPRSSLLPEQPRSRARPRPDVLVQTVRPQPGRVGSVLHHRNAWEAASCLVSPGSHLASPGLTSLHVS